MVHMDDIPPGHPRLQCHCLLGTADQTARGVELAALLADPGKYAGLRVRLRAYVVNEFEDYGLYEDEKSTVRSPPHGRRLASCHSLEVIPPKRAIWWDTPLDVEESCDRQYVTIEGIFDPCEVGHMGLFVGGLHEVNFITCSTDQ